MTAPIAQPHSGEVRRWRSDRDGMMCEIGTGIEQADPRDEYVHASDYDAALATIAAQTQRVAEVERFRSVDAGVEVLLRHRIAALEAGLRSIAANTCCGSCQEAAMVARAALSSQSGSSKEGA